MLDDLSEPYRLAANVDAAFEQQTLDVARRGAYLHSCHVGRRDTTREELARWVGQDILPHERDLRSWLRRRAGGAVGADDVVQECYCRLAQLEDVSHILNPRAYLFTVARNIVHHQLKAARIVHIEAIADLEADWPCDRPSPERVAVARDELARVATALAGLTERAQRIFLLRKLEGMAQRDIARILGVSENVVENDASRGLRAVLRHLTEPEPVAPAAPAVERARHVRSR